MSYQPFDRNPSGIVFFTNGGTEPVYDSDSNFILATGSPGYIQAPNLRISNGGKIGSVGATGAIDIASNGNVTFSNDVSVGGSLVVNGTLTSVNTDNILVKDPLILLSSGNIANTNDIGFFGQYSTSNYLGLFSDASDSNKFKLFTGLTAVPTTTVNTGGGGYTVGTLVANLEGNVTGNSTTATTLQNSRFIGVSGMMTGSGLFNGSADQVPNITAHHSLITAQTAATSANSSDEILIAVGTNLRKITKSNFISGLGAMTNFKISDGLGNIVTIDDNDTLLFRGGTAISFAVSGESVSGILNAAVAGTGLTMSNQILHVGAGAGITVAADTVAVTDGSGILVNTGGVHANLVNYTVQSVAAQSVTTTASRTYAVQVNGSDQLVVNVPWVDTDTNTTYTAGTGLSLNGTVFNLASSAAGSGLAIDANGLHIDLNEYSSVAIASGDRLFTLDQNAVTEQLTTISDLGSYLASQANAGIGSLGDGKLTIDLSEYVTPVAFASGDSFLVLDSDGITEQRGTVSQLGSYMAGTNVTAAGDGKLSVTDATIEGVVFTTANFVDSSRIDFTATAGQSVTADLVANSVSETYLTTSVAGVGLAGGNGTALTIDLNEYSSVAIASGDRLFTLDSNNATEQLTTISNLGSYLAGTNVTAAGDGKLSVTSATIESVVFTSANFVDSTEIDFTVTAGDSVTAIVINDSITDTKLRNSAALSVIGRSANSTGDPADIAAGTDNQVLRRSGTSLGFGAINLASSDAVTGDLAFSNLAQGSALSVLGVTGNATADVASIAAGVDGHVLRRSGTTLAFGTVATAGLANGSVTEEKRFRDVVTLTAGTAQVVAVGEILLCNAASGPISISSLPAHSEGKIIRIKKTDSSTNTVTISVNLDGSQKILYSQYESLTIVSDGSNWHII